MCQSQKTLAVAAWLVPPSCLLFVPPSYLLFVPPSCLLFVPPSCLLFVPPSCLLFVLPSCLLFVLPSYLLFVLPSYLLFVLPSCLYYLSRLLVLQKSELYCNKNNASNAAPIASVVSISFKVPLLNFGEDQLAFTR